MWIYSASHIQSVEVSVHGGRSPFTGDYIVDSEDHYRSLACRLNGLLNDSCRFIHLPSLHIYDTPVVNIDSIAILSLGMCLPEGDDCIDGV